MLVKPARACPCLFNMHLNRSCAAAAAQTYESDITQLSCLLNLPVLAHACLTCTWIVPAQQLQPNPTKVAARSCHACLTCPCLPMLVYLALKSCPAQLQPNPSPPANPPKAALTRRSTGKRRNSNASSSSSNSNSKDSLALLVGGWSKHSSSSSSNISKGSPALLVGGWSEHSSSSSSSNSLIWVHLWPEQLAVLRG